MKAQHQSDLVAMDCATPGCAHEDHSQLLLHGKCHLGAPSWAKYDRRDGTVTIQCALCDAPIAKFQVAP